jgi:hypothetical protein
VATRVAVVTIALVASSLFAATPGRAEQSGATASASSQPSSARARFVTPRSAAHDASTYSRAHGYHVGIAVRDLRTGRMWGSGDYRGLFASESVVKVFIATRLIISGQMYGRTKKLAYKMITRSDDGIASSFYGRVGGDGLINWVKHHYKVWDLGTRPRHAGWWGNTHIRPTGLVKLYGKLAKDPRVGPWLLHAMRHAHKYGSDGTYQFFGLPSATRGAAVKQGWGCDYSSGCNEADFNSTGYIAHHRYAVAILMRGPLGSYGSPISKAITAVARHLLPNGAFPLPGPTVTHVSRRRSALAGGDRLVVHGTNFGKVTSVSFGDRSAQHVHVVTARKLIATVPARTKPKDVYVRVTTRSGLSPRRPAAQLSYVGAPVVTSVAPPTRSSAGGQRITVQGDNLIDVTRIAFGAKSAPHFTVRSPHTMRVVVPAHPSGSVHLVVHTRYGASAPQNFTYTDVATVDAVAPSSGSASGGDQVTITGTNFVNVQQVTFGAASGSSPVVTSATSLTVTTPAHDAGVVNVHVITASGKSATVAADRFSYEAAPSVSGRPTRHHRGRAPS